MIQSIYYSNIEVISTKVVYKLVSQEEDTGHAFLTQSTCKVEMENFK